MMTMMTMMMMTKMMTIMMMMVMMMMTMMTMMMMTKMMTIMMMMMVMMMMMMRRRRRMTPTVRTPQCGNTAWGKIDQQPFFTQVFASSSQAHCNPSAPQSPLQGSLESTSAWCRSGPLSNLLGKDVFTPLFTDAY